MEFLVSFYSFAALFLFVLAGLSQGHDFLQEAFQAIFVFGGFVLIWLAVTAAQAAPPQKWYSKF